MTTRQTVAMALLIAVFCAGMVWYLEKFEREKLSQTWLAWVNDWQLKAKGEEPA